ncbi:MAG: glutamine amidotransferase [Candidatus Hadarchaeota archaeon]
MRVLILGELEAYARYLLAVTKNSGFDFLRIAPEKLSETPSKLAELQKYDAVVISDGPAQNIGNKKMELLKEYVEGGKGLGMIGGWWSFTGSNGNYHGTPVEEILPVKCSPKDDRVNDPNGFKIIKKKDHPILKRLPWNDSPTVCGYNAVTAKAGAEVLLSMRRIESVGKNHVEEVKLAKQEAPLLVVGEYGDGRTLAFTTDLSPHWVGGMVDWGKDRKVVEGAELGNLYLQFGGQILKWLAGKA